MDATQIVTLALLQGLTEFLPISSSGHLVLLPSIVGWSDQGLAFDVAVHVGTLVAVIAYFRRELLAMARDFVRSLLERRVVGESRLAWAVIVATLPGAIAGAAVSALEPGVLRSPLVIGLATIGFGLLLWWADRRGARIRDERALGWREVALVGCAQALALIPGTSRSGVTMTAALALGLTRTAAARFSFLLSIPIIAAAGLLKGVEVSLAPDPAVLGALAAGAVIAGASAYACIHWFLKLLDRIGMLPFVLYRMVLGGMILWVT